MRTRGLAWLVFAGCVAGRAPPATRPVNDVPAAPREPSPVQAEAGGEPAPAPVEAVPVESGLASAVEPPAVAATSVDEPQAARPGLPSVYVAPVTVGPKHSPALIRRVILQHKPEFERCGANAEAVALRFTIGVGGVVSEAEARGAAGVVSTSPVHVCLVTVLRSLRFPTDMAGLIVSYPLR